MRLEFPSFQLSGVYLRGGSPRWETRCCRLWEILTGIGRYPLGGSGTSTLYIYGANRLLGWPISDLRLPGNCPFRARYRSDVNNGAILRLGFPNFQLSGKCLRGIPKRWKTSWLRGGKISGGVGCYSFGWPGTSPLYINGQNRLLRAVDFGPPTFRQSPLPRRYRIAVEKGAISSLRFPNFRLGWEYLRGSPPRCKISREMASAPMKTNS